jgi:hypothetical protein
MAVKLALYIKEQVEDIHIVTTDQLYDLTEQLIDEQFMRVSPHQYGYCLLFEDGQKGAACINSKYDNQKSKNGEVSLCMKCPNMLIYLPVNQGYLEQTRLTHANIVHFHKNKINSPFSFSVDGEQSSASQLTVEQIDKFLETVEE